MKMIFSLFIALVLLQACPNRIGQEFIYITNNSDKIIVFQALPNYQGETFYCSDTGNTILIPIKSNSTFELYGGRYSSWDTALKSLKVFILDGELYKEYLLQPCDTTRKYVPVLHIYQLTLEDLQRMNWTIVYPPEE